MTDAELKLLKSFPGSFIDCHGWFHPFNNFRTCIDIRDCNSEISLCCWILPQLSAMVCTAKPYILKSKNERFRMLTLKKINDFFDTEFLLEDIELIYTRLGNNCNRPLCEKFVLSGYDMEVLR